MTRSDKKREILQTYVIAEIGVNHNGKINNAFALIDAAKESGANAVKFQTFSAESLAVKSTSKVRYQMLNSDPNETHFEMLKALELSHEDHVKIKQHCMERSIDLISTHMIQQLLDFLVGLGLPKIKIASADIVDHLLLHSLAKYDVEIMLSVGMASLDEIDDAIDIFKNRPLEKLTILHCVSNYPCSDLSLNLKFLTYLQNNYPCNVGFSDHSVGHLASVIAVSLGARVIEKHFTLDKNLPGPDHAASATPKSYHGW